MSRNPSSPVQKGSVVRVDTRRGTVIIQPDDGGKDITISADSAPPLAEGDRITYDAVTIKGETSALNIRMIEMGNVISDDDIFGNLVAQGDLAGMMAMPNLKDRIKAVDDEGWTPLHWAALYGHQDISRFLIAQGAEIDAKSKINETPLMVAAECRHKNVFMILLEAGADAGHARHNGDTAADILKAHKADDMLADMREHLAQRASVLQKPLEIMPSPTIRKRSP